MGLDITAYETIQPTEPPRLDNGELDYDEMYERGIVEAVLPNLFFNRSFRGLEAGRFYRTSGDVHSFHAGSYSGYNHFRSELSVAVLGITAHEVWDNLDEYRDKPFFEIINFSDCEGTIGPEACADLAKDFAEYSDKVFQADSMGHEFYRNTYEEFMLAFQLAAHTGLVNFH